MQSAEEEAVVTFTGLDDLDHEMECESVESAQHEAAKLEEIGCQCVAVLPIDEKKQE